MKAYTEPEHVFSYFKREDEPFRAGRVEFGRRPGSALAIYAFTEADIGLPTVGVGNFLDLLTHMTPDKAEEFARALLHAAKVARGEASRGVLGTEAKLEATA